MATIPPSTPGVPPHPHPEPLPAPEPFPEPEPEPPPTNPIPNPLPDIRASQRSVWMYAVMSRASILVTPVSGIAVRALIARGC
jgi:hypothetical protein